MVEAISQDNGMINIEEYLAHERKPDVLYELFGGKLMEMPGENSLHRRIVEFFKVQLTNYLIREKLPLVAVTGMEVRTEDDTSRTPDVVVCTEDFAKIAYERGGPAILDLDQIPLLVIEVTGDNGLTDYTHKLLEYSWIKIPEYWIVDPNKLRIRLCRTNQEEPDDLYQYQDFQLGDRVQSVQFVGFELAVSEILSPSSEYDIVQEESRETEDLKAEVIETREEA